MTQPQIDLLPCPACQASGDAVYEVVVRVGLWQIYCVACGTAGPSGTKQDAFDRWQQMPRSSPQVAPGLRDEVTFKNCPACNSTHVTRNGDMVSCTCGFEEYAGKWDSVPRRADIAAAQGGQVVDRSALNDIIGKLMHAVKDVKERFGEVKVGKWGDGSDCALKHTFSFVEIVKQANALDRFDFNSAVQSPPGVGRVQAALSAYTDPLDSDEYYAPLFTELRDSIDALGAPQGSDSLRYTAELPTVEGWYWRKVHNHAGVVRVKKNQGNGTFYLWETPTRSIKPREFIEWAGPITEPAQPQPVAAGEAGDAE